MEQDYKTFRESLIKKVIRLIVHKGELHKNVPGTPNGIWSLKLREPVELENMEAKSIETCGKYLTCNNRSVNVLDYTNGLEIPFLMTVLNNEETPTYWVTVMDTVCNDIIVFKPTLEECRRIKEMEENGDYLNNDNAKNFDWEKRYQFKFNDATEMMYSEDKPKVTYYE